MTDYLVVAERCFLELRKLDLSHVNALSAWLELQAVFHGDRVTYPSAMAAQDDLKGRRDFFCKMPGDLLSTRYTLSQRPRSIKE